MIKNENAFLGKMIQLQNKFGRIDNNTLVETTGIDYQTAEHMLNTLSEKHYITVTTHYSHVNYLGFANYVPVWKQLLICLSKILLFTFKELFVFALGIAAGIIISYFTWKSGWN